MSTPAASPFPGAVSENLQYWRKRILETLLHVAAVAGFLVVVPSVWLCLAEGLLGVALFDIAIYALVLYLRFGKKLSFVTRAACLSLLSYLLGLALLWTVGPFGAGPVWLFVFPVIAEILVGSRAALAALALNAVTLSAIGVVLAFGLVEQWTVSSLNPVSRWIVVSINYLFLNLIVVLSLRTVLNGLQSALSYENRLRTTLHEKQGELQTANAELQKEIEEKRVAAQSLKVSEHRFRRLFNEAPVIYVLTENRCGIPYVTDVNALFLSTLGYAKIDVLNRPLADFYAEASKRAMAQGGYERALSGQFSHEERCLLAKDGGLIDTELYSVPEFDSQGRLIGTRAMFVDITARKRAEAHAKMLEANMHRSQRIEALGTLSGGIAHDFNNILSGIMGYSELCLLQLPPIDPLQSKLKAIFEAGGRARDLVKQILTFSRREETALSPVQIGPLVKEVLKLMRASLPATIHLRHSIQTDLPLVLANSTQIHQVMMNLCTNAAHAMDRGGGMLNIHIDTVEPRNEDAKLVEGRVPGRQVHIQVLDSGCGIPPEVLPRIFEPYFTTKEKGEGTGLGLAVVHGIVKSYHGEIQVKSTPGQGTCVDIFLPVIDASKPAAVSSVFESTTHGKEHILLVDDELMVLDIARRMLENLGYRVTPLSCTDEALALFAKSQQTFDLLFFDVTMPKLNGDQLAARMRIVRSDIPVLLATGYSKHISPDKLPKVADAILMKPFTRSELAAAVHRALDVGRYAAKLKTSSLADS